MILVNFQTCLDCTSHDLDFEFVVDLFGVGEHIDYFEVFFLFFAHDLQYFLKNFGLDQFEKNKGLSGYSGKLWLS